MHLMSTREAETAHRVNRQSWARRYGRMAADYAREGHQLSAAEYARAAATAAREAVEAGERVEFLASMGIS